MHTVFCILYFAHWSNTNYEIDYMELISTKAGDVHVQSYGPNLTITSCPSHTELLWRTRPCPRWCRCPGRPSGGCSGGRHSGETETPPPPPVCPLTHRHTDTHINTMTWCGLRAVPSEKLESAFNSLLNTNLSKPHQLTFQKNSGNFYAVKAVKAGMAGRQLATRALFGFPALTFRRESA